jgi:hypothetical protein
VDALAVHSRKRSGAVDTRTAKAIEALRREGAPITVSSIARRAGLTRNSIHRRKDALAQIRAHRLPGEISLPESAVGSLCSTDGHDGR